MLPSSIRMHVTTAAKADPDFLPRFRAVRRHLPPFGSRITPPNRDRMLNDKNRFYRTKPAYHYCSFDSRHDQLTAGSWFFRFRHGKWTDLEKLFKKQKKPLHNSSAAVVSGEVTDCLERARRQKKKLYFRLKYILDQFECAACLKI